MLVDAGVGAQFLRQHLGQHVAGGVVVMDGARTRVARKHLEVERTVRAADEVGAPGLEIADHLNDVVYPDSRELGIDQFAAVFQDVLEMELGAVILAYGGRETATSDRRSAAGGTALGHLDDRNARFRAFKSGHGASRAAADDENVGVVTDDGNLKTMCVAGNHLVGWTVLGDFDKCIHAGIGERGVVDVQWEFLDWSTVEVDFEGLRENLVLLGAPPWAAVVAGKILGAALSVLAEALERNQHAHRSLSGVQTLVPWCRRSSQTPRRWSAEEGSARCSGRIRGPGSAPGTWPTQKFAWSIAPGTITCGKPAAPAPVNRASPAEYTPLTTRSVSSWVVMSMTPASSPEDASRSSDLPPTPEA